MVNILNTHVRSHLHIRESMWMKRPSGHTVVFEYYVLRPLAKPNVSSGPFTMQSLSSKLSILTLTKRDRSSKHCRVRGTCKRSMDNCLREIKIQL